jgi:hypothetical protein
MEALEQRKHRWRSRSAGEVDRRCPRRARMGMNRASLLSASGLRSTRSELQGRPQWRIAGSTCIERSSPSTLSIRRRARSSVADSYRRRWPGGVARFPAEDRRQRTGHRGGRSRHPVTWRSAPAHRNRRALLADPLVLLLDETTSRLDARTEAELRASLDRLRGRRTGSSSCTARQSW